MKRISWILAVTLVVVAVAFGLWSRRGAVDQPGEGSDALNDVALQQVRLALAATESLETDAAEEHWQALFQARPDDRSVALNRALNRVLRVDALTEQANNAVLTQEQRQAARSKLPSAIELARSSVTDYAAAAGDPVTGLWLNSRVDLREASLLPQSMGKSLRLELFDRLASALESDLHERPFAAALGGSLVELLDTIEDPIRGLDPKLAARAATALETLSQSHPDNLFLSLRSARLNIAAESASATDAVRRTQRLASAIEPSLRAQTSPIGLTPDDLVNEIIKHIEAREWEQAGNRMLLWFNVLNGTELVKSDRRRATPHPLDRLSFRAFQDIASELSDSRQSTTAVPSLTFSSQKLPQESTPVTTVVAVDADLDLDADLVTATDSGRLTFHRHEDESTWRVDGTLDTEMPVRGLLAADLFMVDSSDAQRLQVRNASNESDTRRVTAARHTTLATVVAFGEEGAKLVVVDGRADVDASQRLSVVDTPTGLEDLSQVRAAIAGDLEGDGDLDLVFATGNRGIRVFVNRGNRTFFEVADPSNSLANETNITAMTMVDLDRDLDLDIVTLDAATGKTGLVENLLHLQFRFRTLDEIPAVENPHGIIVAELDSNVSWDIVSIGERNSIVTLSQTADSGTWNAMQSTVMESARGPVVLADFDNDAWLELVSLREDRGSVMRIIADQANPLELNLESRLGLPQFATDLNFDGKIDLISIVDGMAYAHLNRSETTGHHLNIRFKGIDDNNANSGRVNHYAIGSVIELRSGPHYQAKTIRSPSTHFGLGDFDSDLSVRVIFPNGLTQTITSPTIDTLVEEEQTLKGSCPYLYAWNGEEMAFVTDCLWAAPLGLQVARGVVAKDRPWEYLKIDGSSIQPIDGHYELSLTEELWEVAYFDHLSLEVVDHPRGTQIWTNEKVGPANIAERTIFAFHDSDVRPLVAAKDHRGSDVSETLTTRDGNYFQGFDRRIRQGLCPPHWMDLDFGSDLGDQEKIYLVVTGWILPTDTSLNIQIDQNPELPAVEFPSIWVPDDATEGGWRQAIPFMGFPGGKTKTIVVDVSDVIDRDDPRLRVRTSAQIYWDHAALAVPQREVPIRVAPAALVDAKLHYRGFSQKVRIDATVPETYDYSRVSPGAKWPPLQGRFTRFGDVRKLLEARDDWMVVMGSGDEMQVRFAVPDQELPEGWQRDFVLHCVGWDKDADLNTLTGQSSEPFPFQKMSEYPPTMKDAGLLQENEQINAPYQTRRQRFRDFWVRPE